jgi:hypothetical protein
MLQKFKITTCVFILCLFGLTLMTVTPVFATESGAFVRCVNIGAEEMSKANIKKMLRCFKPLALDSDGRKGPAYQQCARMTKGPSEEDSWPSRKLDCFRALVSAMGRNPNPERQTQYEMSYKHNCVFNTQHSGGEQSGNAAQFIEAKARCDAAKIAACKGKKGTKKAKCKKTWEAGLRVFLSGLDAAKTSMERRPRSESEMKGGILQPDGTYYWGPE